MRSYHNHVQHLLSGPVQVVERKPTFRASAIFPVFHKDGTRTRFLFMGYWFQKRQIHEVTCVATLRSLEGTSLCRTSQVIRDAKAYRIEVEDLLNLANLEDASFEGSVELEFFAGVNLVFPYPACVVNYYGPDFSAAVHSAQRVYNDFEDYQENSELTVPESGFNLYADKDIEPFFAIINGSETQPHSHLGMEFYNIEGETLSSTLELGDLKPYETKLVYPRRVAPLDAFLKGKVGAAKISFDVKWIYPRLIAGNIQHSLNAVNITHSYYDCTDAATENDYWFEPHPDWNAASLMVPCKVNGSHFTNCYFYPILSPCSMDIAVEIYREDGTLLGRKEKAVHLESPNPGYTQIRLKELCQQLGISLEEKMAVRLIANPQEGSSIPARIKIALDLGCSDQALPCNICTNFQPFNIKMESKPRCFRWGPILADLNESSVWFLNSSPKKDYQRQADIHVIFHREKDTKMLERRVKLAPHGSHCIQLSDDLELQEFLESKPGWYTATSATPHLATYYFVEHQSGVVGGDHGF